MIFLLIEIKLYYVYLGIVATFKFGLSVVTTRYHFDIWDFKITFENFFFEKTFFSHMKEFVE